MRSPQYLISWEVRDGDAPASWLSVLVFGYTLGWTRCLSRRHDMDCKIPYKPISAMSLEGRLETNFQHDRYILCHCWITCTTHPTQRPDAQNSNVFATVMSQSIPNTWLVTYLHSLLMLLLLFIRTIPLLLPIPMSRPLHLRNPTQSSVPPLIILHLRPRLLPQSTHLLFTRRHPLRALPRTDVFKIHRIQFLQRPALALNNKQIYDDSSDKIAACEDIAVFEIDGAGDEGCEERDQEIPEPVRGGAECHSFGAVAAGKEFAYDCPYLLFC